MIFYCNGAIIDTDYMKLLHRKHDKTGLPLLTTMDCITDLYIDELKNVFEIRYRKRSGIIAELNGDSGIETISINRVG